MLCLSIGFKSPESVVLKYLERFSSPPTAKKNSKLNQIECVFLPKGYAVLVHGFLVIIDCHQEITQHSVQDTVTLIGQRVAKESDPFFIFLLSAFNKEKNIN